jgi:cytochrome c peroxidase
MRKFTTIFICGFIFISACIINACSKNDAGGTTIIGTPVKFEVPPGWPQPQYNFTANPLTKEGIELGRHLFYEGKLSKDGQFPCASCHQQASAFATFDHDFSHGVNNQFTTRNAPGLFNLAWHKEMHLDGGINHIEIQPLAPLTATNEMGETIDSVIFKLKNTPKYPAMFKAAFGSDEINSQRMLKALTQFMLTLVSNNSKFDKVKRNEANFTATEAAGYNVFAAKCATCHREPLFTDLSYRNVGLPINTFLRDYGRMRITNNSADSLKFKVPSLRNVQVTFPYTHDGRFYYTEQMINFYKDNVVNGPTTDPLVRNKIPLNAQEVNQLIYFLNTLTDSTFIKEPKFSQPQ